MDTNADRAGRRDASDSGAKASLAEFFLIVRAVWPAVLGLGLSQAVLGMTVYSAAAYAEHVFVPSFGTIAASVPLIVLAAAPGIRRIPMAERTARILGMAGVAFQALSSFAMAVSDVVAMDGFAPSLAFAGFAVAGNMLVVAHWLRLFKGRGTSFVVVAAFVAMALCEMLLCALAFAPHSIACVVGGAAVLLQIPLMGVRRSGEERADGVSREGEAPEYLKVAERLADNPGFLISSLLAAVIVSVTVSLLWGFPYGTPHALAPLQRVAGAAFSIAVLLSAARLVAKRHAGASPVATWMVMQALGLASLACYASMPSHPAFGMAFLLALNDVSNAYIWCIVVAFMSHGRFDAHCYGIGGITAFLLPGALARAGALALSLSCPAFAGSHFPGDMLIAGMLGALIVLPAQIVLLSISKAQRSEDARVGNVVAGLTKVLGLGDGERRPTDMRRAFLDEAVAGMKETFMLSGREADVLALYALGFTQEKISKELHISVSTTHTHITHIYAKTNMHSRQEIIDYLDSSANPSGLYSA